MESTALTAQPEHTQQQVLAPMTPQAAREMMLMYQEYQQSLLDDSDYQNIQGKKFKKKSAWRKFAMANNLSVRIVDERREELPNDDYAYHFVAEATHPNGRVTSGSGSCTAMEKGRLNSLHNVRSTAETRAWNRAVSNMIAAGEVSAEEVDQGHHNEQYVDVQPAKKQTTPTTTAQSTPINQTQTTSGEDPRCPQCGGAMWDCRTREDGGKGAYPKTNPAAPDWRCKQKCLRGVIWPKKQQEAYDQQFHGGQDHDPIIIDDEPPITHNDIPF